jgi:predicted metal-dependent RNase
MRIAVHGAGGGEVTGSAYLVQTPEANVLVDFGLFQGARKVENYNRIPKRGVQRRRTIERALRTSCADAGTARTRRCTLDEGEC